MPLNEHTFQAALREFESLSHAGDIESLAKRLGTGLVLLTGIIGEMAQEIEALRAEVRRLPEG